MRSVKLCFNATLFRKNMARFWPIWGLYGIIWLFCLALPPLAQPQYWDWLEANRQPLNLIQSAGVFTSLLFGVMAAMAVFSYLYNSRPVGLMHSLPIRREGLFLTNYLSGLCFFLLPNVVVFLLALGAEAFAGAVCVSSLLIWLLAQSLLCLFFYSFAVFCAMFTGNLLALPVFYGILNGLVSGVVFLFDNLAQEFLYGYVSVDGLTSVAKLLTPVWSLASAISTQPRWPGSNLTEQPSSYAFLGLHVILLYAVVGLILAGIALLLYRRRHLERAGDLIAVRWVRPVFKYGVAICSAVALGTFVYAIFYSNLAHSAWTILVFMILWGIVGYFVAEMLLKKTFRVFRQGWKGCIIMLVCMAAAVCAMELDVTGFERRTPEPASVESVQITWIWNYPNDDLSSTFWDLDDPDDLELFTQLHQAIIREKDLYEQYDNFRSSTQLASGLYVEQFSTPSLNFSYFLENGSRMERRYNIVVTPEQLADPNSAAALLTKLLNTPQLLEDTYFRNWYADHRLVNSVVTNLYTDSTYTDRYLDSSYMDALLIAIRDDIQAGRLGIRYLLEDEDRLSNCYLSDLNLTFYVPEDSKPDHPVSYDSNNTYTITISLQATASETLAVLRQAGVIDDDARLITQRQSQEMQATAEGDTILYADDSYATTTVFAN